MRALAKPQIQPIWERMVQYANGDLRVFRELLTACMCWSGLVEQESLVFGDDSLSKDIFGAGSRRGGIITVVINEDGDKSFDLCRDVREGLSLEEGARRYQQDLRRVLTWLVNNSEAAGEAFAFLWTHGKEQITIEAEVNTNKDLPFLYFQKPSEYGSIASPMCKFILDRIDRYNDTCEITGQYDDLTPDDRINHYNDNLRREIIPLGICTTCKKFMIIERRSKRYCSDKCRVQDNQAKMTKADKARKMRRYREDNKRRRMRKLRAAHERLETLRKKPAYKSKQLH